MVVMVVVVGGGCARTWNVGFQSLNFFGHQIWILEKHIHL